LEASRAIAHPEPVSKSDEIELNAIDRRTLPNGNWTPGGVEQRPVSDIEISFFVKEYQALNSILNFQSFIVLDFLS
jgi:hypothetical protein